ncbi:glycosyltransferase [Algirhabdus cladophorae]|uniref:glycosyltransferase n=1 Tax=Algirhabdus cladophorae TaxID=3377108 RepID=UPI003B84A7A7
MTQPPKPLPRICVVVPAYQAANYIARNIAALFEAGFDASDITVVDDGSTDNTGALALQTGVTVLRNERPMRPAAARNRGVRETHSDIVLFVDADVVVHADIKTRLLHAFQDPTLTAVFGSYDTTPDAPRLVSRYRNLLHHYVHQQSAGSSNTFWTGLGAVRRTSFEAVGGFDITMDFMEDVELGQRLNGGHIVLDPALLGTHLKDWTLWNMFKVDLWHRAVPWTRLIMSGRASQGGMNLSRRHQLSAASVGIFALSFLFAIWFPPAFGVSATAFATFLGLNAGLLRLLLKTGGLQLMVSGIFFHAVHYIAAMLGYLKVRLFEKTSHSAAATSKSGADKSGTRPI